MKRGFFVVHRFSLGAVLCARSTAVSVFVLLVIGLSLPAVGQTSANGSIRGSVRDPPGGGLPGTTITATSAAVPTPFTVASDRDGYYRLLELPPGEYDLSAERQGFARFVRPGIVTRAGLNLTLDIDLFVGPLGKPSSG